MKRSKNSTWLLILMIISQIMLTGLLIQWLSSQWGNEKESLRKDINQQLMECIDQVMDSMLIKHLIVPVLNDSSVTEDHLVRFNKKIKPGEKKPNQHISAFYNETGGQKHTIVTISMPDSGKFTQKENIDFTSHDSAERKMLLRSVKLIIQQTGDSVGKWSQFSHMTSSVPDTILLKKLFEKKIRRSGIRFEIRWISDSVKNKSGIKGSAMLFESDLFEKPFNAEIMHYRGVIFRGISAQILFALVLLLFTGAAFFFTYRNLIKQETLNNLRNDFIANISHELKTPVSTVSIALEALKKFDRIKDPVKSGEYLEIAINEMKRLDNLISQVLNTAILEYQSQFLQLEDADLVSLTRDVLSSMQVRFAQSGAKVDFQTASEIIFIKLDSLHVHGVLINLLDNSLKYCSANPEIKVSIEQRPESVILTIRDNGPGIPKEYISRVFDKFFRVPKGDIHDIKGYGLGLSYAELVMKNHSGSISVRNINEGGCEFTLTFTLGRK